MPLPEAAELIESETDQGAYEESEKLLGIENNLCTQLQNLEFKSPIEYIYNPLQYAKELHEIFVKKYFEKSRKKIMFLGINPGPWGMSQTGIPFGEKDHVKDWFKINGSVGRPDKEHPKRQIKGLNCHRREASGKIFWGFFKTLCKNPENFFKFSFVYNWCPFAFLRNSGANVTPPEIKEKDVAKNLEKICDDALSNIIKEFNFEVIIGIGKFPGKRARKVLREDRHIKVFTIPHPSRKNAKKWEEATLAILHEHNMIQYFSENDPRSDERSDDSSN